MGKAHKYFPFMQSDDRPNSSLFGGLNTTAKAFARATKGNKHHFHSQRIALTMFLAFLFMMAVACFNKLSFSTQTAWLFAPKNCCIGRFYGRCPNPQFLKKLSKLFCFWEDNLALAKLHRIKTPDYGKSVIGCLSYNLIKNYFLNPSLSDTLRLNTRCSGEESLLSTQK